MNPLRRLAALTAPAAVAALLTASLTPAFAVDTITLKSGEELVGTILSETDSSVTIEYNATPRIKDIKTISREEISDIHSETPAEIAYRELEAILPADDLLSAEDYDKLIAEGPAAFLREFPNSPQAPKVNAIIATLEEEKAKAAEGFRKFDGQWLPAEEFERKRFNIEAAILFSEMKSLAEDGQPIAALRKFSELEENYGASKAFPEAVQAVIKIIPDYQSKLREMQDRVADLVEERERGVQGLVGEDRVTTQRAIDAEEKEWEERRAEEEAENVVWRSVYAHSEDDVKKALQVAEKELARLSKIDTKAMAEAADFTAKAMDQKATGNYDAALAFIKRAEEKGVNTDYVKAVKEEIVALQAAAQRRFEETGELDAPDDGDDQSPQDGPASPDTEDAAEDDISPTAGEEAADSPSADPVTTELLTPADPEITDLSDTNDSSATDPAGADEDGGLPIQMILFGAIGLLLLVVVIAKFTQKPTDKG